MAFFFGGFFFLSIFVPLTFIKHNIQFQFFMENEKNYKEIEGIESLECVCALTFPDSATDFQKSSIVLAHMMASVREIVLKGGQVPPPIISRVCDLAGVMMLNCGSQK